MTVTRKTILCALALAFTLPLASGALAHEYKAFGFGAKIDRGRNLTTWQFTLPDRGDGIGQPDAYYVYLNWCVAKNSLPANWSTQPNKTLRTDSMCASAPAHSGRGPRVLHPDVGSGHKTWTMSGVLRGRHVLSVTSWIGIDGVHSPNGSAYHTTLGLLTPTATSGTSLQERIGLD